MYVAFLKAKYDLIYDSIDVDSDKVQLYIKEFFELHTIILNLERKLDKETNIDEKESNIDLWKNNMDRYASAEEKSEFKELYNSYEASENDANRQYYYDEMNNKNLKVITNSFDFLGNFYLGVLHNSYDYTDAQKAEYWKTQAQNAIRSQNVGDLRQSVFELLALKTNSANGSINSVMADLKI